MTQNEEEICKRALFTYGFEAQATMVSEECSELINALCKYRRGRVSDSDVITEVADVMIMCEQMACYFGKGLVEAEKERKLQRLKEKLSN
jgi:NTP pyrophosphatase (non-canonical NTP hydrolase)|nr:MAG TPA: nucleoside triphosphate pyrophosphohydrolase [Caudoviricetes sp.]